MKSSLCSATWQKVSGIPAAATAAELLVPEKYEDPRLTNAIDTHSISMARYRRDFDDEWRRPKLFEDKLGVRDIAMLPFGDHPADSRSVSVGQLVSNCPGGDHKCDQTRPCEER